MTRIVAVSDMHGYLAPNVPECELLLIAGDTWPVWDHGVNFQKDWARHALTPWLEKVPAENIVAIAGNHDFIAESNVRLMNELPWTYLMDETVEVAGLKIHGTPWVTKLGGWAFCTTEDIVSMRMQDVPKDIDILLSHAPPYQIGDKIKYVNYHVGSTALANHLMYKEWPNLKHVVFGHIHEGFGRTSINGKDYWNVAYLDHNYDSSKPNGVTIISV